MIITSKHFIIGAIILILALKVIFNNDAEEDTAKTAAPPAVEVVDWSLQKERELTATQRRISGLEQLEERQKERAVAAKDLSFYRQRILNSRHAEWTVILEKYWAEYQQLLGIAKQSHAGVTDCTICGGDTYLNFCIFCAESSNGICATCLGDGLRFGHELCPSCRGNGKCFMGTSGELHRMICPFCDDGSINVDQPAPSPVPIMR
jgi:hypothetical protein